ncbi:hypothetical protein Hypma_010156 [Hypsizygus marmoreus]|uniref:DUF6699 domain-containing protein n=1 Tax=Hypsizygus marmoreus TaxID=39966 RepID=A0A369JJW1_HYPMA|nr:hypothetical protein Hypma_010156 [Hypsizygus marmoreus]
MPGKHVRFQGIPPTPPSLYSSNSSLPSTDGPITPPSGRYMGSPHAYSPLPKAASRIHSALRAAPGPYIRYDLSLPPTTLQLAPSMPSHVLRDAATEPPLPVMTITCRHVPWKITVRASGNPPYVTVMDVFDAIYSSLRLNVTESEFGRIPTLDEQRRVDDAYRRRYKRIGDVKLYELEKAKGVKRVDFLQARTMFAGLTSTMAGPEVWELNVS